jgi:hypothetical protein
MDRLMKPIATLAACLIAVVAYFGLTPFSLAGVQSVAGSCDTSPDANTSAHGSWSGAIFEVAISQAENCGVALHDVSVQRLGDELFVRTTYRSPSGMYTGCNCRHQTTLRIPDLAKGEYRVHVYSWP